MTSSFTTSNRIEKFGAGDYTNTWGTRFNTNVTDMIEQALDGLTAFTLSGTKTLTAEDGESDEARARMLNITGGTGGTVTIPAVSKAYLVRNNSSGNVIIDAAGGSGATVTIPTLAKQWVFTDGTDVFTDQSDTAFGRSLRAAADATATRTLLALGNASLLTKASTAQTRAGAGDVALIADNITNASAIVSLTDGATVAVDWTSGINFDVTLTANRALGNPSNVVVGTTRTIMVKGNNTTDRTLTFGSNYKGFIPTLADIDSGQYYLLSLFAYSSTHIVVSVIEGL